MQALGLYASAIDRCQKAPGGLPPNADALECHCCERTLASMQRYCKEQQNMGDLEMALFDCSTEMDPEPLLDRKDTSVGTCACDCASRLEILRQTDNCPLACEQLPFFCPQCTSPPPAPPRGPPPLPPAPVCLPVEPQCCGAVVRSRHPPLPTAAPSPTRAPCPRARRRSR